MAKKITLPPSDQQTEIINFFSDKLGQKLKNTQIVDNGDGTENVELELDDKIVTIIMDQSGSMTWNDNNNFRQDVATDLINKIDINYPGNITYNLIEYGADIINVLFFGIVEKDGFDPNDVNSLGNMIKADEEANYDGMRILRNDHHYPTSPLDGDIVYDGFSSRIKDEGLTEGKTYYYTIFTYDKDYRFSEGVQIKVAPRDRIVPRATSSFKTVVESDEIGKGVPFIGRGVNRDDNTIGIWHMNEGSGSMLYDFSDSQFNLNGKMDFSWVDRGIPTGDTGLYFNGNDILISEADPDNLFEYSLILGNSDGLTIMGWFYFYDVNGTQILVARQDGGSLSNYSIFVQDGNLYLWFGHGPGGGWSSNTLEIESNKWQHLAATFNRSGGVCKLYKNGVSYSVFHAGFETFSSSNYKINIGHTNIGTNPYYFHGKMTELSIHNVARDSDYINSQLKTTYIYDENENIVDSTFSGLKDDNGDRLVVFKYDIPRDYNYIGGEVIVAKKEKRFLYGEQVYSEVATRNERYAPSWEEDGTIIYQESDPGSGQFFISDIDDFALGEKYYYRLFVKNSLGNVSFLSDSPALEITIPESDTDDHYLSLDYGYPPQSPSAGLVVSGIPAPVEPIIGQLITAGNKKTYLRWRQTSPFDSRISRVKIYYSSLDFPVVGSDGGSNGSLVYTGLSTDEKFVHRNLINGVNAFYTIVNVDKYGRTSNYNSEGAQVEDFLFATVVPDSSASEDTFPLVEIDSINYELVDSNSATIGWRVPLKNPENIDAYFDQTVYIYASITDEFGDAVSEDTPIKMRIASQINKETQADDVFNRGGVIKFEDEDAYDFFVTRSKDGTFIKAILKMSTNNDIISQIKDATFQIQLKALFPKEGGYAPPNENNSSSTNASEEYIQVLETLIEEIEGGQTQETSNNFFEYYSEIITVSFTNPWEVELVSRDNQRVSQRCYCVRQNEITGELSLGSVSESFNMKASAPFVARAKLKYKGEPVESGNIQVAVWDADSSELCRNACVEGNNPPPPYEGPKLQPSTIVSPPSAVMSVIQGEEETYNGSGVYNSISYVDIPLYAPESPQAVRLFVKGEKSGYSSIKELYILFQSILKIDIQAESPLVDGKDIGEQRSNVFIINPDYPNYETSEYDKSLVTYPDDLTVVEWGFLFVQYGEDGFFLGG